MKIKRTAMPAALLLACACSTGVSGRSRPRRVVPLSPAALKARAVRCSFPQFPVFDFNGRTKGSVVVRVVVETDGRVSGVRAISGHPLLQQSAVASAFKWMFKPYELKGRAFRVTGVLIFPFSNEARGFEDLCKGLPRAPQT